MKHTLLTSISSSLQSQIHHAHRLLKNERKRLKLRKRGSFITSSWVSLAIRPFLEKDYFKAIISAPVMAAAIVGGVVTLPSSDVALKSWDVTQPVDNIISYQITTPEKNLNPHSLLPVTSLLGISQYYHGGHPGIDLRATMGSDVVSINQGHVKSVEYSSFGYGHHVLVEHDDGLESMYAHLGTLDATPGEFVAAGEIIGQIGMTGMTTGPHLHFELIDHGVKINPLPQLKPAIAQYSQQFQAQTESN